MTVRAKGMDFWKLCAELGRVLRNAILGRPDALNCTNHARGRSDQIVYRAKGIYVYTENGHRPLLARIEWMTSQAHVGPDLGASVRFRPILLKNSFSTDDEKILGVIRSEESFRLGGIHERVDVAM